jgi:hypothetical protein
MKKIAILFFLLCTGAFSVHAQQTPSYVPTNGLIGWYPFNNNGSDKSNLGNHGTVNGAVPATDRFGVEAHAYRFNGLSDNIEIPNSMPLGSLPRTVNFWIKTNQQYTLVPAGGFTDDQMVCFAYGQDYMGQAFRTGINHKCSGMTPDIGNNVLTRSATTSDDNWHMLTYVVGNSGYLGNLSTYFDGVQINNDCYPIYWSSIYVSTASSPTAVIGKDFSGAYRYFKGLMDDLGLWNRTLSQAEITALYQSCDSTQIQQPASQTANIGDVASFSVYTTMPNAAYQWQQDAGTGFTNLTDAGQFIGVNTNTLTINQVQSRQHNAKFRCLISTLQGCHATTNEVSLRLSNYTGLTAQSLETIQVYPNPVKETIIVNGQPQLNGRQYALRDWSGRIVRSGQLGSMPARIQADDLPSGIYLLQVQGTQPYKIVKQ